MSAASNLLTDSKPSTLAAQLNEHLRGGGRVQVTTYTRSTIYDRRHADWFSVRGGCLYVRRGKHHDCLSMRHAMLVGVRMLNG